jgi:transcriptional regulator with XRE-family HTH domain
MRKAMRHKLLELIQEKERKIGRRLTASEIASGAGVSIKLVTRWLDKQPKLYDTDAIIGFCEYFQCGLTDLLEIIDLEALNEPDVVN